jgi:hypothetical protein
VKNALRTAAKILALACILLALIVCVIYVLTVKAERKATQLLNDCRNLKIGISTEDDVRRIVRDYGGESGGYITGQCQNGTKTSHSVAVESRTANLAGQKTPMLRPFGNSYWVADANFAFENGRLCFLGYYLLTYLSVDRHDLTVSASVLEGPAYPGVDPYTVAVGLQRNTERFQVQVWTDATAEQHQHALDIDLSCLSLLGGCRTGCELMPLAWLDYQKTAREKGWALPPAEVGNPRCPRLLEK